MLSNINLEYYKIFYEVASTLNITQASKNLLISQPAVTQTIHKLEEQLNTKLFVRQSRGLVLTKMGELILNEVSQAFMFFSRIENIVEGESDLSFGKITIGCATSLAKVLLVEPVTKFNEKYKEVKIKLIDKAPEELLHELSLGQIDMVITQFKNDKYEALAFHKLLNENYVFVCHKDYAKEEITNFNKLKNYSFIVSILGSASRGIFDELNEKNHWNLTPSLEVSGYNMSLELIKNKVGIGFLPEYLVSEYIENNTFKKLDLPYKNAPTEYGYFINSKVITKALKEFLKYINAL